MFKRLNDWIKKKLENYLDLEILRDSFLAHDSILDDYLKRIEALEKNLILRREQERKLPYKKKGKKGFSTTIQQNPNKRKKKVLNLVDDSPLKIA